MTCTWAKWALKNALYTDANFEFKINGRLLESNSYLLRQSNDKDNMITSNGGVLQNDNSQGECNTSQSQDTVQSSQFAVGESRIATSEQSSDNKQHINASDFTQQETNVTGDKSSAIPNTNDLSSEDVNRIEIIEEISRPPSEKTYCDRSGDDISAIGASGQEWEILKTYSIVAELVDAINEKEGNSVLVFPDNRTDEGSAVAENLTEQSTDYDMLSNLDIETLKDIPHKSDASQNHSGSGNISDNVESNESEPENNISDNNTESDHNIPQFSDCNVKAPEDSSNENGMDRDDNVADDDCPPICLCWLLVRKEKKFLCAVTVCLYSVSHVVHPL